MPYNNMPIGNYMNRVGVRPTPGGRPRPGTRPQQAPPNPGQGGNGGPSTGGGSPYMGGPAGGTSGGIVDPSQYPPGWNNQNMPPGGAPPNPYGPPPGGPGPRPFPPGQNPQPGGRFLGPVQPWGGMSGGQTGVPFYGPTPVPGGGPIYGGYPGVPSYGPTPVPSGGRMPYRPSGGGGPYALPFYPTFNPNEGLPSAPPAGFSGQYF